MLIKKLLGIALIIFVLYCYISACLAQGHFVWQHAVMLLIMFNPVGILGFAFLTGWLFDIPEKE